MALSIGDVAGGAVIATTGGIKERLFTITGDTSYPANGYAVTPANFGLTTIHSITDAISGGKVTHYNPTSEKVEILECGGASAALVDNNDANVSAISAVVVVRGS